MSERFVYFTGASVDALREQLNAGPVDRVEVRGTGTRMTLTVVPAGDVSTQSHAGGINDSHVCPPDCP